MSESQRHLIIKVKELLRNENYRLTMHAEEEREADRISIIEIEEALLHNDPEMIEDYPNDPRGHSFLLLGLTGERKPIHALCSIHEEMLVIITIYRPNPNLWVDWKIRRGKI
jgi:hypothetical protein